MSQPVLIAGAGIAGLTAALALAGRGLEARVVERVPKLDPLGAGIQLSPNATRILFSLGLEAPLRAASVRPEAVRMFDARTGRELAHVPLGAWGEERWGAPYLTVHRGDLQEMLLEAAERDPLVSIGLASPVEDVARGGETLIGADGVHSQVRKSLGLRGSRESGLTAWRAMMSFEDAAERGLPFRQDAVCAFLHPRAHLVSYPVRGGRSVNIVAFAGTGGTVGRSSDRVAFAYALRDAMPALAKLTESKKLWSAWDLRTMPPARWVHPGSTVLIGDAAHATTPFAAQGAAMGIEDAATLAAVLTQSGDLQGWEAARKKRFARLVRRGLLNRVTWHAEGPVALARNALLKRLAPEKLATDLDWLYGWRANA